HQAGTRAGKLTAAADLVTVGEWLHSAGYATPEQTCLSGGSAGGVLVLSAVVRRPELWGAVIAVAPLADMIHYERFGIGRLWTKEFGAVIDPQDFAALLDFSPYHQAQMRGSARYPAVLLCGFDGDTRTDPEHPRKMCAALQWANAGERPVLLRYEAGVGHSARTTTREIDLAADAHAFAAAWTGLNGPDSITHTREEVNIVDDDDKDILLAVEDLPTTTAEQAMASKDGNDGGEVDGSSDFI
ncbi:MAG: prolyl oligopeptidase family serine peptidase, partial [Mycobacteriales bacterium]